MPTPTQIQTVEHTAAFRRRVQERAKEIRRSWNISAAQARAVATDEANAWVAMFSPAGLALARANGETP